MITPTERTAAGLATTCQRPGCKSSKGNGVAFCTTDLYILPANMRGLGMLEEALRFFDSRFRSVKEFRGGKHTRGYHGK